MMDITSDNFVLLRTVYQGDNFGSSLQAFALKRYVEEQFGMSCLVIENKEKGLELVKQNITRKTINFIKSFCSPRLFVREWSVYLGKGKSTPKYSDGIIQKFAEYTESQIIPVYLSKKDLKKKAKNIGCKKVITGSDQVWSPVGPSLNYFNFLCFSPKSKNISYAASLGVDKVPYYNYLSFKKKIKRIKYVSVREENAQVLLKKQFHVDATCCLDPVLLVGTEFWKQHMTQRWSENYVFCYFLNCPSVVALEKIRYYQNRGIKVIVLSRMPFAEWDASVEILDDVGPFDFLSYVCNANAVLTDSFHGMAFSIVFSKDFFVFERDYGKSIPQVSRITSLLTMLNIEGRYISDGSTASNPEALNYSTIQSKLEEYRVKSAYFLSEAMKDE